MKWRRRTHVTGLAVLGLIAAAPANTFAPASAAGKWVIDQDDSRCLLTRTPPPGGATTLEIALPLRETPVMAIFSIAAAKRDLIETEQNAELIILPGEKRFEGRASPLQKAYESRFGLAFRGTGPDLLDAIAAADGLAVSIHGKRLVEVGFNNAGSAVKALRKCRNDLLTFFGIDPEFYASLREVAKPKGVGSMAQWFHDADYPVEAMKKKAGGLTVARITVATNGRARDCTVVVSSGEASLDLKTCAILVRRGQFEPAIGADGKPTDAPIMASVNWRPPRRRGG